LALFALAVAQIAPLVMPYWLPSLAEHITVEYDIPRMGGGGQSGV